MAMTLITTNTSSGAASSSFTSSIDSTYKLYILKFIDANPATDDADFTVNFSTDGGSNYNMTKTTTFFKAHHYEDDSSAAVDYSTGRDIAQGTGYQILHSEMGSGGDECGAGTLWLFNPSNTTYVKHFYSRMSGLTGGNAHQDVYVGGYVNSTSDVDAVQFKMSSGNMDAVIKMYGVG